ncbi:MAG: hypothetical protein ACYTGB_14495, partial [Planctomycetota bacterium]
MRKTLHVSGIGLVLLGAACALLPASAAAAGEPAAGGTDVLTTTGFWRCHFTWRTEEVKLKSGEVQPSVVGRRSRKAGKVAKAKEVRSTSLPPENWQSADFDDAGWFRARGPFYARNDRGLALMCLRGKFEVTDPAVAAPLSLSLTYRGGAVVYVNGKEVG